MKQASNPILQTWEEWVKEQYWDEIDEEIWGRLGLFDYKDIRHAINADFDDPSNVYNQLEVFKENIEGAIAVLDELIEKLELEVKTVDKKYKAIFKILSKMDAGLKAGEVLSLMEEN